MIPATPGMVKNVSTDANPQEYGTPIHSHASVLTNKTGTEPPVLPVIVHKYGIVSIISVFADPTAIGMAMSVFHAQMVKFGTAKVSAVSVPPTLAGTASPAIPAPVVSNGTQL